MYNRYAEVFEEIVAPFLDYDHWARYIAGFLAKHGCPAPADVLDLGCGAGHFTTALAKLGYRLTGVDLSPEMLERARTRAAGADLLISFVESDMTAYTPPAPADAAVITFDTIVYLASLEKLDALFANLAASLKPGGLFVCNLLPDFTRLIDHNVIVNNDKFTVFYEPTKEDRVIHFHMTGFIRRLVEPGESHKGLWEKFQETHSEREHSPEELQEIAGRHGFALVDTAPYHAVSVTGREAPVDRPHYVFKKERTA